MLIAGQIGVPIGPKPNPGWVSRGDNPLYWPSARGNLRGRLRRRRCEEIAETKTETAHDHFRRGGAAAERFETRVIGPGPKLMMCADSFGLQRYSGIVATPIFRGRSAPPTHQTKRPAKHQARWTVATLAIRFVPSHEVGTEDGQKRANKARRRTPRLPSKPAGTLPRWNQIGDRKAWT